MDIVIIKDKELEEKEKGVRIILFPLGAARCARNMDRVSLCVKDKLIRPIRLELVRRVLWVE